MSAISFGDGHMPLNFGPPPATRSPTRGEAILSQPGVFETGGTGDAENVQTGLPETPEPEQADTKPLSKKQARRLSQSPKKPATRAPPSIVLSSAIGKLSPFPTTKSVDAAFLPTPGGKGTSAAVDTVTKQIKAALENPVDLNTFIKRMRASLKNDVMGDDQLANKLQDAQLEAMYLARQKFEAKMRELQTKPGGGQPEDFDDLKRAFEAADYALKISIAINGLLAGRYEKLNSSALRMTKAKLEQTRKALELIMFETEGNDAQKNRFLIMFKNKTGIDAVLPFKEQYSEKEGTIVLVDAGKTLLNKKNTRAAVRIAYDIYTADVYERDLVNEKYREQAEGETASNKRAQRAARKTVQVGSGSDCSDRSSYYGSDTSDSEDDSVTFNPTGEEYTSTESGSSSDDEY